MRYLKLIPFISTYSVLLPTLLCLLRLKTKSRIVHLLLTLTVISAACDFWMLTQQVNKKTGIIVLNIQDIIQFLFVTLIYREMSSGQYNRALIIVISIYFFLLILNSLYFQPITVFQNYNWTLAAILIIFMAIGWMLHIIIVMPVKKLIHYGEFWINTSFFFYFSISLFMFLSANYVFKNGSLEAKAFFWSFHNVNNILKNVLMTIGIYFMGERFANNKLQVA